MRKTSDSSTWGLRHHQCGHEVQRKGGQGEEDGDVAVKHVQLYTYHKCIKAGFNWLFARAHSS